MVGTMLAEAAAIKGDLPGHPFRGNQWTGVGGGGSWIELDRGAAKQEGLDVLTGSDIGESKLRSAADYIDQKMGDLEDARQDDSHEWKALSMMNTAVYAHINTKLSEKVNRRSAVVFKDGKIVAAGTMKCDKTNGHISHVGATEKGSGKYVIASLIRQAVDKKLKTITADASPDAVRLLSKFGFQRSGPDNENGTPMKWIVSQKFSRLAIAKHLLSVATQAVQLKRMLLKDQLRNAVVKAVHIKQYEQTEAELAEAVAGLIKRQFADAGKKLGRTKDELELIEKGDLPGHPFRGNQWSGGRSGGSFAEMSPDVADAVYEATEEWAGDLDQETGKAVYDYTGDGHRDFNNKLRLGKDALSKEDKQTARLIDDAMVPLQGDAVLFRGVSKDTWDSVYAGLKEGDTIRDKAYSSTSMSRGVAEDFTADGFAKGGVIEIAAPKGTMCLPVGGIGEMEILLPRGMEMKVVAVDHERKVISVVPISQGSRQPPGNPSEGWDFSKLQKSPSFLSTKSPSKDIFDPRDWDNDLVDTCLPILMKHAGEAAAAQMLIMGVDIAPRKKVGRTEKGDLPGHPFRGNQWTGGGEDIVPVFTGMTADVASEHVFQTGLLRGKSHYNRPPSVYFSTKEGVAKGYARTRAKGDMSRVAVVEFELSKEMGEFIRKDEMEFLTAFRVELDIPSVCIKSIHFYGDDGKRTRTVNNPAFISQKSIKPPFYSPIVLGKQAKSSIELSASGRRLPSSEGIIQSRIHSKTTATEWLLALEDEGDDLSPLWPEVFALPGGGTVDLGFATEWPDWMKAEISKQMKETFEQPFWAGINDTTAAGIQAHVEKGLLEGLSIREIRQQMVGDGLDEYYHNRGINIARTESGNALNGARSAAMDRLAEEVPGLKVKRTWMSVLGTTTRDTHASLDGVPADRDGLWYLGGVRVPWPGHWNLPAGERCNCQCTLMQGWGMADETAEQLIEEYNQRLNEERDIRDFWTKGDLPGHPFRGNQWGPGRGGAEELVSATEKALAHSVEGTRERLAYIGSAEGSTLTESQKRIASRGGTAAQSVTDKGKSHIIIRDEFLADAQKEIGSWKENWTAIKDLDDLVRHEVAHVEEEVLKQRKIQEWPEYAEEAIEYPAWNLWHSPFSANRATVGKEVSDYAATSGSECFAECRVKQSRGESIPPWAEQAMKQMGVIT